MPTDERDDSLGAELRRLPVPPHDENFWSELHGRLAAPGRQPARVPVMTAPDPDGTVSLADLDERRDRRQWRRRFHPGVGAAAAALAAVLLVAGLQWAGNEEGQPRGVTAATQPGAPAAEMLALAVVYRQTTDGTESKVEAEFAEDGSYRVADPQGYLQAYDASTRRGYMSNEFEGPDNFVAVATDLPPGGPDHGGYLLPFGGPHAIVAALAATSDPRISATEILGRAAWHYAGPYAGDQLGGRPVPSRMEADVDQETGALLSLTIDAGGRTTQALTAISVDEVRLDRDRFRPEPPPGAEAGTEAFGFEPTTLDQVAATAGYDVLVPGAIPSGFRFASVTYNAKRPSITGAEGSNPATARIAVLQWRDGSRAFTVTLRPEGGGPDPADSKRVWADPFGREGTNFDPETVRLELPGRPALAGEVIMAAPAVPHLWGITGNVVVTVDGDLARDQLRSVAASLRPYSSRPAP